MLYSRALLMMLIGLYTSRVILRNLGVTDFGIYNAVGAIVTMFGFISGSLSNATSRFITIAIGRGDQDYTNKTFGNLKVIYYCLCLLFLVLGETIGLWFLYSKMTIPDNRMNAALWVYQYSIASTILEFICVPYNSAIVAHERMSAFAWISLLDAIFKLLICFLIAFSPFDRLIFYATLLFLVNVIDRIIYAIYCNKHFEEVKAKPRIYKEQFKEIFIFSGWTVGGNLAWILNTQGINLLLNMFFGPVVNAARGIALQVQGVMTQFANNFQTAVNPQITKSYAREDFHRMRELIQLSSKFSYFLLLLMFVPVFIEAPLILKWWLVTVPDNTVIFLRLILCCEILYPLSSPLITSIMATGKIQKYQIIDSTISILVLPIVYFAYKYFNAPAYIAFVALLIRELICLPVRIWLVLPLIHMDCYKYLRNILVPIVVVTIFAPVIPTIASLEITSLSINFFTVVSSSIISTISCIWLFGLTKKEQDFCSNKIKAILLISKSYLKI